MAKIERFSEYCDIVEKQIRWKKAKPQVRLEIENHLVDQGDAYLNAGDSKEEAIDKAILQMGDAEAVGRELDAFYRPKPQWFLLVLSIGLLVLGAVLQYISCSYFTSEFEVYYYVFQPLPILLAGATLIGCYFLDFIVLVKNRGEWSVIITGATVLLTILSPSSYGIHYIALFGVVIPILYIGLFYPLVYTMLLYEMRNVGKRWIVCAVFTLFGLLFVLNLVMSNSKMLMIGAATLTVLEFAIYSGIFCEDRKYKIILAVSSLVSMVVAFVVYCLVSPYRMERIKTFLDPDFSNYGSGYVNSLIQELMAGTQFIGKGSLPSSMESIREMPFSRDFILSYMSYEYGWIVFAVVVILFVVFFVVVVKKIIQQPSLLGKLISLSIFSVIAVQAVVYFLYNLGYSWFEPISLPLVSFRSTTLVVNGALIGFMMSVFRTGGIFHDEVEDYEDWDDDEYEEYEYQELDGVCAEDFPCVNCIKYKDDGKYDFEDYRKETMPFISFSDKVLTINFKKLFK